MIIWNQWLYRQNFTLLTLLLRLMPKYKTNLLRGYEQKLAELPEQQKLTKLCSNAVFLKNIEKGQFFITLDDEAPDKMKGSSREYTLPRSEESSRVGGGSVETRRSAWSWM